MKKHKENKYEKEKRLFGVMTVEEKKSEKIKLAVYLILRILVVVVMIAQVFNRNWDNVFMCALTLMLFVVPSMIEKKMKIELPNTLEIIILLFIFAAEILGEVQEYYLIFETWDDMLHTMNGFLCAAIGFSLIDILNRSEKIHMSLSPKFVALTAFCFSMTVGVIWEFYEFGADYFFNMDMQKDTWLNSINSVELNPEGINVATNIVMDNVIVNGQAWGARYLDIGLYDTMSDLFVNFIGAVVFSIFGLVYIKTRGSGNFVGRFIPKMKKREIMGD